MRVEEQPKRVLPLLSRPPAAAPSSPPPPVRASPARGRRAASARAPAFAGVRHLLQGGREGGESVSGREDLKERDLGFLGFEGGEREIHFSPRNMKEKNEIFLSSFYTKTPLNFIIMHTHNLSHLIMPLIQTNF